MAAEIPSNCFIIGESATDCPPRSPHTWLAIPEVPGEYWSYFSYVGARPTRIYESPFSYSLVKQGLLPPLDERLPPIDELTIAIGPDGIGEYGGSYRQVSGGKYLGEWTHASHFTRDANGFDWYPWAGKDWSQSDDGRVYTFELRGNGKFSDGSPLTTEQARFAWEDHNFNPELNEKPPVDFRDAVTGNAVTFNIIDEYTFTITYDTANFTLMQNRSAPTSDCRPNNYCMYASDFMRKYHKNYISAAQLAAEMNAAGVTNFPDLWNFRNDVRRTREKPCLTAWCPFDEADEFLRYSRNHFYPHIDPEGNQLPYTDEAVIFAFPDRDTAIFRAMAGEQDGRTTDNRISEVPLYVTNMKRGDYSLYHWISTSGGDIIIGLNQTYDGGPDGGEEDRLRGTLLHTKEFRTALSLAMDRDDINEFAHLGRGIPQNWVPHPSTPYYPGDQYKNLDIERDVDRANKILDDLGLTNRDADGFRTHRDGTPLVMDFDTYDPNHPSPIFQLGIMFTDQLKDVGIRMKSQPGDPHFWGEMAAGTTSMNAWEGAYQANPWMVGWTYLVPLTRIPIAPKVGTYRLTKGEEGMAPTGPDPAWTDLHGNLAPADTYPADLSGNLLHLQNTWRDGAGYFWLDPQRIELGKEIFRVSAEENFNLNTHGFTGTVLGVLLNRNNFKNQPRTHIRDHTGFVPWVYCFEDGADNEHHPGNRSKYSRSWSFIGGFVD